MPELKFPSIVEGKNDKETIRSITESYARLKKELEFLLGGALEAGSNYSFPAHNDLTGKQGGSTNQFYHLSQALYNLVSTLGSTDLTFSVDNIGTRYGAGTDMEIIYDGANGVVDTSLVTPSDLVLKCGTDKTLLLNETVYDDLPPVPLLIARVGANAPTLATFKGNIQQYTFDATNDEVFGASEVTHKYKEGTNIEIHIHWATNGTEGTQKAVKWEFEYTISNADGSSPFTEAFGNSVVVSAETAIPASTADRAHIITNIGTITGTNIKIGAYICWRLRRIAASGTAPAADPFGLALGFHVQMDTIGSRQEYIK